MQSVRVEIIYSDELTANDEQWTDAVICDELEWGNDWSRPRIAHVRFAHEVEFVMFLARDMAGEFSRRTPRTRRSSMEPLEAHKCL